MGVTRPADEAVLPVTQERPTHLPPVVITIDTTSAVVSGPAGNPTWDAPESDEDGNSEENAMRVLHGAGAPPTVDPVAFGKLGSI